tara:strand:+ start:1208 stop:1720 length:513 start_codon:yes stop_codon:yes gene_type:complete
MFNSDELFNEIAICEFCGVNLDTSHEHSKECPINFINPANYQNIIASQYDIEEEFSRSDDLPRELGMQLLMAIDTILDAQRSWAHKSLMSKFSEVLNRYTDLTNFVKALYNSGVLDTAEDVIKFLEMPEEYDELFAVWMEHGQPNIDDIDTWKIFLSSVELNGWKNKNQY